MNNIESNGSFFPSVKAKKINKTHSHKTMNEDFEDKSIYASNNSQSEIKDLIKGYYHGFFKHKKKIKPITVSISVG